MLWTVVIDPTGRASVLSSLTPGPRLGERDSLAGWYIAETDGAAVWTGFGEACARMAAINGQPPGAGVEAQQGWAQTARVEQEDDGIGLA